jgi:hypothetical protein
MDKKKLFALASFTAVAGVFVAASSAGCSSSSTSTTTTTDAGKDSGKSVPPGVTDDGGGDDGSTPPTTCPDTTPITSADIDSQIGWKPPVAIQSVCTDVQIGKLDAAFNNTANKTYDDVIKDVTASIGAGACLSCIVTDKTAANWGVLVSDPMGALPNFGACYAGFPGSNAACGKANEYLEICVLTACQGCADQNSFDACSSSKGITKACADPIMALQTSCGSVTGIDQTDSAINKACGDIVDGASTLCNGGKYDGGVAGVDGG